MTEALLRTRAHITLYLLAALVMSFLAVQNVRYGFYDLFYASALFVPALLIGALYGWAKRNDSHGQLGHLLILSGLMLLTGVVVLHMDPTAHHWAYVLGLFGFLVVPLRSAIYLNIATACWISITLMASSGAYSGIRFFTSFSLLAGLAGVYAYLYHHKARSLGELAIRDTLTGAYNRRHLDFTLKQELARSEATKHPVSLIALEIDYYAQQLDAHGKGMALDLLPALSQLLRTMTRAGDSIYYGGDGLFYLLLPFTPQEGLLVIAERIRRTVEEKTWPTVDRMTVSLGCVTRADGQTDDQVLLQGAHQALRDARNAGHNRISHNGHQRQAAT